MLRRPLRRGLFVHAGALGDFVLALRVVSAMGRAVESVAVLGRREIASLALGHGVDEVLDIESGGWHRLFAADASAPAGVVSALGGTDLCVNMLAGPSDPLSVNLARLTGTPQVTIDPRPRPGDGRHISDQWLDALRCAGWPAEASDACLRPAPQRVAIARRALHDGGAASVVLVHPGSGGVTKCWPAERFLELADQLRRRGHRIATLIGPAERERFDAALIGRFADRGPLLRDLSLADAAACLAAADAYAGNDSGITHLACAVGTPTMAIFGQTDPRLWQPRGRHAIILGELGRWPAVSDAISVLSSVLSQAGSPLPCPNAT